MEVYDSRKLKDQKVTENFISTRILPNSNSIIETEPGRLETGDTADQKTKQRLSFRDKVPIDNVVQFHFLKKEDLKPKAPKTKMEIDYAVELMKRTRALETTASNSVGKKDIPGSSNRRKIRTISYRKIMRDKLDYDQRVKDRFNQIFNSSQTPIWNSEYEQAMASKSYLQDEEASPVEEANKTVKSYQSQFDAIKFHPVQDAYHLQAARIKHGGSGNPANKPKMFQSMNNQEIMTLYKQQTNQVTKSKPYSGPLADLSEFGLMMIQTQGYHSRIRRKLNEKKAGKMGSNSDLMTVMATGGEEGGGAIIGRRVKECPTYVLIDDNSRTKVTTIETVAVQGSTIRPPATISKVLPRISKDKQVTALQYVPMQLDKQKQSSHSLLETEAREVDVVPLFQKKLIRHVSHNHDSFSKTISQNATYKVDSPISLKPKKELRKSNTIRNEPNATLSNQPVSGQQIQHQQDSPGLYRKMAWNRSTQKDSKQAVVSIENEELRTLGKSNRLKVAPKEVQTLVPQEIKFYSFLNLLYGIQFTGDSLLNPNSKACLETDSEKDKPVQTGNQPPIGGASNQNGPNSGHVRCFVGEGNNQKLVQQILKERPRVELEGFFNRADFLWTQKSVSSFKPLKTSKLEKHIARKVFLKDLPNSESVTELATSNEPFETEVRKFFFVEDPVIMQMLKSKITESNSQIVQIERNQFVIANHIRGLKYICRKALLAQTICEYCEKEDIPNDKIIPKTFLLRGDTLESDLEDVIKTKFRDEGGFDIPMIVKPGEFSNRGNGIAMAYNQQQLKEEACKLIENRKSTSWVIVQNYITRPLLYKNRKFDIRCYGLVVRAFDRVLYYWYRDGYIRTSSFEYDMKVRDNLKVHLTNEAVQVKGRHAYHPKTRRSSDCSSLVTRSISKKSTNTLQERKHS